MVQDGKAFKFRKETSGPNGKGTCLKRASQREEKGEKNGRSEKIKLWIDISVPCGERFICDRGPCFPRRTRG